MIDVKGVVPLWAAWESEADRDTKVVERSWFKEVDPPYRTGRGIRLRLGRHAVHVGIMWPTGARTELDVVGREVGATVEDISDWRPPAPGQPRSAP